jgi:amidase
MVEDYGAFVPGPRARLAALAAGPLNGLTFVVKDLIDVAGHITGAGNPDWAARQAPATRSAPIVERLRRGGAQLVGKTVTDELAFSLEGENAHYGTPVNPRAPEHLPGGSSSGSAVAVAAGLADLGLGTDTGGSVRVPASFCGLFGWRPTHGRLSMEGIVPFAPSYDTVGLLARDAVSLQRAAQCLLGAARQIVPRSRGFVVARDAFTLVDPAAARVLSDVVAAMGPSQEAEVFAGRPGDFAEAYSYLQGMDIARTHDAFLASGPCFGPTLQPRFESVRGLDPSDLEHWNDWRAATADRLHRLLPQGTFLLLPAAPSAPPRRFLRGEEAGRFYATALTLNSVAGHARLPAVTVPAATLNGLPLGLGIIGGPGQDEALIEVAVALSKRTLSP